MLTSAVGRPPNFGTEGASKRDFSLDACFDENIGIDGANHNKRNIYLWSACVGLPAVGELPVRIPFVCFRKRRQLVRRGQPTTTPPAKHAK